MTGNKEDSKAGAKEGSILFHTFMHLMGTVSLSQRRKLRFSCSYLSQRYEMSRTIVRIVQLGRCETRSSRCIIP